MTKQSELSEADREYLRIGRAVVLQGMRQAASLLNAQIYSIEKDLFADQATPSNGTVVIKPSMQRTLEKIGHTLPAPAKKKRQYVRRVAASKGYWESMTPEERKAEMARRYQARGKKKKRHLVQPNHPRNADHPKHAEWLVKMRAANRASWDRLSPAKRKVRAAAAVNARLAKQAAKKPTVKMEQP